MGVARALLLAACIAVSSCASTQRGRFAPLGVRFSHRVPFEIGHCEREGGNTITIAEVRGTRPVIEVGGSYIVKGTYKLTSADEGELVFWQTAKGWNNSGPDLDAQAMRVRRGQGEFVLLHGMPGPGYFHVALQAGQGSERTTLADVYFGHGETLLRKDDIGDILALTRDPGNGDAIREEDSLDGFNALNDPSLTTPDAPAQAEATKIARPRARNTRLLRRIRTLERNTRDG